MFQSTFKQYLRQLEEDEVLDAKLAQQEMLDAQLKQKELANNAKAAQANTPIQRQQQQVAKTKGALEKAKLSADKQAADSATGQTKPTLKQPGQTSAQTPGGGAPGVPKV
jgi:hypothetical protein